MNMLHRSLYRFALLVTGDEAAALGALKEVFSSSELRQFRDPEDQQIHLFAQTLRLARQWRKEHPEPAGDSVPQRLAALPHSTAWALFHCFEGDVERMAVLARTKVPDFVQMLDETRRALAPGVAFPAEPLLQEHRPWVPDRPKVARAVAKAGHDEALSAQADVDTRWHKEIEELPMPEALEGLVGAAMERPSGGSLLRQPAVVALILALLVVMGVMIYWVKAQAEDFPGRETMEEMAERTLNTAQPEMERLAPPIEAGKLEEWFLLKGFTDYSVPPALENAIVESARVFQQDGMLVAQMSLQKKRAQLLVFHLADLRQPGIKPGKWRIFQYQNRAMAVYRDDINGYILTFPGDASEMPAFLKSCQ